MISPDIWLSGLLSTIREIGDESFQERVWLKGCGPEVSSYEEVMCRFFDDYAIENVIDVEWRALGLTVRQREGLISLRDALDIFGNSVRETPEPTTILSDPRWHSIRELARNTLALWTI